MDCHDNHRYHPYAPADGSHERYLGREWYRRGHAPFPSGHRGARNGRYSSGRRGTGSQRLAGREEMYHPPPDHRSIRPVERHLDSRYERPQRRISPPWYQGQVNISVATSPPPAIPMGSTHYSHNMTAKATDPSCSSEKTDASLSQRQTHSTSTGVCEPLSLDKQQASLDSKNPSIAKVEPFSHQPLASCAKSSSSVCTPSLAGKISTDTNIQVKAEDQMVSLCNSLPTDLITRLNSSEVSTPGHQCQAAQDGLMTIYAASEGGELRPIITTICSCQLRQRALKYVDKGKTKDDSIVLDSDDEEEKKDIVPVDSITNQEQTLQSSTTVKEKTTAVGESSCQETPRKRAKMSIEKTPEKRFFSGENAADSATAIMETDSSSSVTCSESEAETVSRIVDGLRQNLGEGCSSSTSSDSLSSANIIEDAPLLANPQILQRILDEYNEPGRPFKKFKVSPRNLYAAAKECNIHKVLAVLAGGCDPNLQVVQAKGKTAMHAAAGGGYVDIIACLRLAGCDLNLVDYDNRTPVFDAVKNHKFKAVEYLIECGANLGMRDTKGMTCFHVAVRQGHTDLIKLLLKTGQFDINEKDQGGWTPIMWAAEDKQFDATQLLIEQGANVHIRDLELNVPLHWAAYSGNLEVCQLLLDEHTHINTVNIHLETPLHIAAREEHYQCVQLFLSRGADIHFKNKDGSTPLQLADPESRGYYLLKGKAELESHQAHVRPRILHSDISRGQENVSISCINEVDDEPFPEFTFIKECCEVDKGMINWSITKLEGCQCGRICRSGKSCRCSKRSEQQKIWYNKKGMLKGDIQEFDRPLIFECNRMCCCWSNCKNRVVQKGMQYPLQLYRTLRKGWGVRSLTDIPQGSFVCEYTGELIPDSEADDRDDDSYLFDLDCKESTRELFCIDAKNYGNISRFINHSCEPNIFPLRVFIDHRDIRFPRIAFFATKDIHLHEEICFNYGDRFWSVKRKEFYCECGTASCKYGSPNC